MVISTTWRHWIIVTVLSTIFFTYFILINICIKENLRKSRTYQHRVKKIVAFSLLKRIEADSELYDCDEALERHRKKAEKQPSVDGTSVDKKSTGRKDEGVDSDAWTIVDGSNLYVYSAYLDKRLDPYHYIRIIAAVKGSLDNTTFFCQILSSSNYYLYLKATVLPIWASNWDKDDRNIYFNPLLISCRLPFGAAPSEVSLTSAPCEVSPDRPTIKIGVNKTKKKRFATICVKPLDFVEDTSLRLIQWIEVNRLLGADKIELYVRRVTERTGKVLSWYNSTFRGKISVKRFVLPPDADGLDANVGGNDTFSRRLWQKRKLEIVAYNDCFYNNIHASNFVVPLDVDEIIIPRKGTTWRNFLKAMFASYPDLKQSFASLTVPNAYYFGGFPSKKNKIYFLENAMRSNYSPVGESGKSFVSTDNTLSVFNHYALHTLKPGISKAYFLPSNFIQMNHYRESCDTVILPECAKYLASPKIYDPVMDKMKSKFFSRYNKTLTKLETVESLKLR